MKTRQVEIFDGFGGKRVRHQFTEPGHVISSRSCLMPKFSITMKAGALRKLLKGLGDEECLTVTVAENAATEYTFVRDAR